MSNIYFTDKCTIKNISTDDNGVRTVDTTTENIDCRYYSNSVIKPGPNGKMVRYEGIVIVDGKTSVSIDDTAQVTKQLGNTVTYEEMLIKGIKTAALFSFSRKELYLGQF